MTDYRAVAVENARAEFSREAELLTHAQKVIRVATVIADTFDYAGLSEKDRYLLDELRRALDGLRDVP